MAERYEIVIDFAKYHAGPRVVLKNSSPPNNIDYANTDKVMAFDVVGDAFDPTNNAIPASSNPDNPVMALTEPRRCRPATYRAACARTGSWTINGHTWDDVVRQPTSALIEADPRATATSRCGRSSNSSGGWFHPVHIHLIDFKVLDRNGKPPIAARARPQGRRLRRRERDGPVSSPVRGSRAST